jgi:hypothetical protein
MVISGCKMNERIQKLAEQAGFKYIKDEGIGWAGNYNASLEKFAELIVRECADLFDKDEMELTLTERTIHSMIKEHFGVEDLDEDDD